MNISGLVFGYQYYCFMLIAALFSISMRIFLTALTSSVVWLSAIWICGLVDLYMLFFSPFLASLPEIFSQQWLAILGVGYALYMWIRFCLLMQDERIRLCSGRKNAWDTYSRQDERISRCSTSKNIWDTYSHANFCG